MEEQDEQDESDEFFWDFVNSLPEELRAKLRPEHLEAFRSRLAQVRAEERERAAKRPPKHPLKVPHKTTWLKA